MISYKGLWKLLIDNDMGKMELLNIAGISRGTLASMGKGRPVHLSAICKICEYFHCRIEDLIEYVPDAQGTEEEE